MLNKQITEKFSGGEEEYEEEEGNNKFFKINSESKDNLSIIGKSRFDDVNESNLSYIKRKSMNFIPMNSYINHSTLDVSKKGRNVWNPYK